MAKVLQRAFLIVLLGTSLGLLANALSSRGIPLITPPKKVPKVDDFIPLSQAHELWGSGNGFFIDARKPADFEAGHIPNALNLPEEEFQDYYASKFSMILAPDSSIVAYCDGTQCELSHHLADQLRQQGHTNVHILYNGISAWRTAGYPVDTGAAK